MLYDLVPLVGVGGVVVVFVTAFVMSASVKKANAEAINKDEVAKLQAELAEIKASLASIEKMMKDVG